MFCQSWPCARLMSAWYTKHGSILTQSIMSIHNYQIQSLRVTEKESLLTASSAWRCLGLKKTSRCLHSHTSRRHFLTRRAFLVWNVGKSDVRVAEHWILYQQYNSCIVAFFRTRGKRLKLLGLLYGVMWKRPTWVIKVMSIICMNISLLSSALAVSWTFITPSSSVTYTIKT